MMRDPRPWAHGHHPLGPATHPSGPPCSGPGRKNDPPLPESTAQVGQEGGLKGLG